MIASIVFRVIDFYTWLIIAYVLMSWFPISGVFQEIYNVIASVVEPYLGIFRRIIPPMGALDISPIVAILVLNVVAQVIARVL